MLINITMFKASEVVSSTSTSSHDVLPSSSASLRERPWTHCFQSKWVYGLVIGSKLGTFSCGSHLSTQGVSSYCCISWYIFSCCGSYPFHDGFLLESFLNISANGGSTEKSLLFDSERLTPRHGVSDLWYIFCYQSPLVLHWKYHIIMSHCAH